MQKLTGRDSEIIEDPPTPRWLRWLISVRVPAALIGLIAFAVAYGPASDLELDRSLTSMFAPDDPTLVHYRMLQDNFGGNAVVLLVYRDAELMTPEGLARNAELSRRVAATPGVRGILSPSRLNAALEKILPDSLASGVGALFAGGSGDETEVSKSPPLLRDHPVARKFEQLFAGYTHSIDGKSGAVVAMLEPEYDRMTIERLRAIGQSLREPLTEGAIVGEPVLLHDGFDLIERDGATLATWTIALLSMVLLISLRSIRFVLLAVVVILWADTLTRAAMHWSGIELSLVSTMLLSVVAVIAVAATLHLGVRWLRGRRLGRGAKPAAIAALGILTVPIAWTCATDAAGFGSLASSEIVPVQQFGTMLSVAAILILLAIGLFAPLAMSVALPLRRVANKANGPGAEASIWRRIHRRSERTVRRSCIRLARGGIRWRRTVLLTAAILGAAALVQTTQLVTETSFLNNFEDDSRIALAYDRVEREFGGAGVWDVVLEAPSDLTRAYLEQVRLLERDLLAIDVGNAGLSKTISLADADAIAGEAPLLSLAPPSMRLAGMRTAMPVFADALVTPPDRDGTRRLRIMMRSDEQMPAGKKTRLIAEVQRTVAAHTASPEWKATLPDPAAPDPAAGDPAAGNTKTAAESDDAGWVTGYYVMMAQLVGQLVQDQWRCFFVAALAVWLLLAVATRSLRLATAAMLPNLLPIFLVLAIAGLLGGKLNMGAAMIAAVSIGLTIDGSVHFFADYRRQRRRGHTSEVSAERAAAAIGLPIVLATVALVIGFGVIASSEFVPTATFGMLISGTLAIGTFVNLTVLPAAVSLLDRT